MEKPVNARNKECLKFHTQERGFDSLTYNCGLWKRAHPITASTSNDISATLVETASTPACFYTSRDVYFFGSGFYTSDDLDSIFATAILESGAHVYSFDFIYTSYDTTPSSALLPAPPSEGVVDSRIVILPIADRGIDVTQCMSVPFGTLGINKPHHDTRT
ncbi:hypothetical protein M9H77_02860 [Catharanthus roseus]|uniref:Uncharacterized protein n=1 Tax=Catharanthus roseus TaxID=4058 RepID=A0ACC0C9S8_CATRO|nr:hypothetical protein M9H77_02860 [Catharanthus roseus]